jgi:hypothetical protein
VRIGFESYHEKLAIVALERSKSSTVKQLEIEREGGNPFRPH